MWQPVQTTHVVLPSHDDLGHAGQAEKGQCELCRHGTVPGICYILHSAESLESCTWGTRVRPGLPPTPFNQTYCSKRATSKSNITL
jgi:hypothetical protein